MKSFKNSLHQASVYYNCILTYKHKQNVTFDKLICINEDSYRKEKSRK